MGPETVKIRRLLFRLRRLSDDVIEALNVNPKRYVEMSITLLLEQLTKYSHMERT